MRFCVLHQPTALATPPQHLGQPNGLHCFAEPQWSVGTSRGFSLVVAAFALFLLGFALANPALGQDAPTAQPSAAATDDARTEPVPNSGSAVSTTGAAALGAEPSAVSVGTVFAASRLIQPSELEAPRRWQAVIETAEKALVRVRENGSPIPDFRNDLLDLAGEARALINRLTPSLSALRNEAQRLGEPPQEGATPEPDVLRTQRERLEREVSAVDGTIRASIAIEERAMNVLASAEELRRARFTERLMTRTQSPLLPGLWRDFASGMQASIGPIATLAQGWWGRAAPQSRLIWLVFAAAGVFLALRIGTRNFGPFRVRGHQLAEPPFFHKVGANLTIAGLRALPWGAALTVLFLGCGHLDLIPPTLSHLFEVAYSSAILVVIVWALAKSMLAPVHTQWRMVPISDASAPRLLQLLTAMAAMHGLDHVGIAVAQAVQAPLAVTVGQSALFAFALVFLASLILRTPWRDTGGEPDLAVASDAPSAKTASKGLKAGGAGQLWPWWLKLPIWAVVAAIAIAATLGYLAMARFLASQLVVTGLLLILAWLAHLAVREFTIELQSETSSPSALMSELFGTSGVQRSFLAVVLGITLDIIILSLLVPAILLQLGFSFDTIKNWFHAAFFGFDVGNVRLSLSQILIGVGIFIGLTALVRLFQGWLDERVLVAPRVEEGLANSIKTGIGYVGAAIASLAAISYAGFDFTNLAIVAGALSVGIGFGLQNIVNNFISGIILLIERPVQVGDWIIAGDAEGYVRRISVRSTEIETFDRASVIVPNSELISGRVTNWTHRSKLGRIVVPIGVSYDAEPEQVEKILLDVAREHDRVLAWPQPMVAFDGFGASSLDFSLRVFIADVNYMLSVRTELSLAILQSFRREGVEIPFPQQDIHLRDLDPVKAALARARDEARQRAEADAQAASGGPVVDGKPTAS